MAIYLYQAASIMVEARWRGDLDGVHLGQHFGQRGHPGRTEFGGDLWSPDRIRIHHGGQHRIWRRGGNAGVMLS